MRTAVALAGIAILASVTGCAKPGAGRRDADEQGGGRIEYDPARTMVVMLGTGTPRAEPDRSGPSLAVVAGGRAYVVDLGPGVVRRASAACERGIAPLCVDRLDRAFVTHLHSDHTAGLADFILTPWTAGRAGPLEIYGPPGLESMTSHVLSAYAEDLGNRLEGDQPTEEPGIEVNTHDVAPGLVYEDANVKVTAIEVTHAGWKHTYGWKFETSDRIIVVSGDTTPTEAIVLACDGCDVLVHEAYAKKGFDTREPGWQAYHKGAHTSGIELGELAARARPKLLVLTHQLLWGGATPEDLVDEVEKGFGGRIAYGNDLDVF